VTTTRGNPGPRDKTEGIPIAAPVVSKDTAGLGSRFSRVNAGWCVARHITLPASGRFLETDQAVPVGTTRGVRGGYVRGEGFSSR